MNSVIVTGASGFIGSSLVEALVRRGAQVVGLTRRPDIQLRGVARMAVAGTDDLGALIADVKPDAVFHLAGISDAAAAAENPGLAFEANCSLVWQLMEEVRRSGQGPVVVLASTIAVYGENSGRPAREGDALAGTSAYELSKIAGECASLAFGALGLPARIARIGNVFGPGDRNTTRLIPATVAAVRAGRAPVVKSPASLRSYLHIRDCVSGLIALAAAQDEALNGRAVNLCHDSGITNLRLVRLLLDCAGREDLVPKTPEHPQPASSRLAHASLAKELLGWQPEVTLKRGLSELFERQVA